MTVNQFKNSIQHKMVLFKKTPGQNLPSSGILSFLNSSPAHISCHSACREVIRNKFRGDKLRMASLAPVLTAELWESPKSSGSFLIDVSSAVREVWGCGSAPVVLCPVQTSSLPVTPAAWLLKRQRRQWGTGNQLQVDRR